MTALIDVPPGLNGVAVADTTIGDVRGDEGFYHYRGLDATALARTHTFEEVWYLSHEGHLPSPDERDEFTRTIAAHRASCPPALLPIVDAAAAIGGEPLAQLRTVLSLSADVLGLRPLIDLDDDARRAQSLATGGDRAVGVGRTPSPEPRAADRRARPDARSRRGLSLRDDGRACPIRSRCGRSSST